MELRVKRVPPDELGPLLREARDAVDLSQRELAERLGVSTRTLQNWEAGKAATPEHRRKIRAFIQFVNCEEAA